MLHKDRIWCLGDKNQDLPHSETIEYATQTLDQYSLVLCTGFKIGNILLLNDSFTEDSLQEYAVVRVDDSQPLPEGEDVEWEGEMIESLTASWIEPDKMREYLEGFLHGPPESELHYPVKFRVSWKPAEKHCCGLCQ